MKTPVSESLPGGSTIRHKLVMAVLIHDIIFIFNIFYDEYYFVIANIYKDMLNRRMFS